MAKLVFATRIISHSLALPVLPSISAGAAGRIRYVGQRIDYDQNTDGGQHEATGHRGPGFADLKWIRSFAEKENAK